MRSFQVDKGGLIAAFAGYELFETSDPDIHWVEWENEATCRLAFLLHQLIRKHALSTSVLHEVTSRALLVRRLEPLPVWLHVMGEGAETSLQFLNHAGSEPLDAADVKKLPGCRPSRVQIMEDTAQHVARSLRAHFLLTGIPHVEVRLQFGVSPDGDCCLRFLNPHDCEFGTKDYRMLYTQLGGDQV